MSIRNPQDERKRALYMAMALPAQGHSADEVISASSSILLSAFKQTQPTRKQAEVAWDEFAARLRSILLDTHYGRDGRRLTNPVPHALSSTLLRQ